MNALHIISEIEEAMGSEVVSMAKEEIGWIIRNSELPKQLDYAVLAERTVTICCELKYPGEDRVGYVIVSVYRRKGLSIAVVCEFTDFRQRPLAAI